MTRPAPTWQSGAMPPEVKIGPLGWVLVIVRGLALTMLLLVGLVLLVAVRQVEKPIHGMHRPWTPYITQFVCRAAFVIFGIRYRVTGQRMHQPGAVVANHSSWLDIFALNARKRVYFVSKSEVADWPVIGWLARATGTVFIRRDVRDAKAQKEMFEARLKAGHKLLFFPEGTSTDGQQILPFKPTLFAAFFSDEIREMMYIQPVTVIYSAPKGQDDRFYGWWGDMDFAQHLIKVLAIARQGSVTLTYHTPIKVADMADRKALAKQSEIVVKSGLNAGTGAATAP